MKLNEAINFFLNLLINCSSSSIVKLGDLSLEQSVDISISDKNSISLSGSVGTVEKYGNGSVSACLRHTYSPDTYFNVR